MLLQPGPTLSTEHQQQPQQHQPQNHQYQQHAPNLLTAQQPSSLTSSSSASSTPPIQDVSRYLETLQEQLKEGWTAHTAKDGRLYYCKWQVSPHYKGTARKGFQHRYCCLKVGAAFASVIEPLVRKQTLLNSYSFSKHFYFIDIKNDTWMLFVFCY
uniref:Uncharacterized protein n=1 Tax=Anopheles culicifacies TaxID=139723 RepID=A0A182M193_9DIPT